MSLFGIGVEFKCFSLKIFSFRILCIREDRETVVYVREMPTFDKKEYAVCLPLKIYSIDCIAFSWLQLKALSLVSNIMTVIRA